MSSCTSSLSSRPIGRDGARVLDLEVAPHELLGVVEETQLGLGAELEVGELGIGRGGRRTPRRAR